MKDNFAYCTSSIYDQEAKKYNSSLLQVVDISDQKNPKILGECDIPGGAWEIDMKNNFLLISNNEGCVSVVDITDSKKPTLVTMLKTGGNSYDITINGDYGYIADGFQGLDIIGLQKKQPGLTASEGNAAPVAVISAYGDRLANEDFIDENPIYFSAMDSYDPEGVNLTYKWLINGNEIKDSNTESKDSQLVASSSFFASNPLILENGKELSCIFKNPGKYSVTLKVSDGALTSEDTKSITVANQNLSIIPIKELRFNVTEECLLLNNSNILLKNIECYLRTPQTYYPYQTVNSVNTSISTVDQVFDNCWNLIEHFKFYKPITLEKGKELKASITDNVAMYEYDFKNLNTKGMCYKIVDPDLQEYTGDDLFIDTDNITIINAVKTAVGGETDPVIKAKKIYNYVAGKLSYDFQRASNKNYEFMNASEILKVGKGVCADYAILYTALLRASGIPARIIGGIPVTIILTQKDKTTDVGHAWVEVKLPGYGWIPVNITQEEGFMNTDYYLDLATEKGTTFLYENKTMDCGSYYYEGFKFKWDGMQIPNVEQTITYKVNNIDLNDLTVNK